MTVQRKVRKDFNKEYMYIVDVAECLIAEKAKVQQAFFDVGITWGEDGKVHKNFNAMKYTNTTDRGIITPLLMYDITTEGCNMTAQEFLDLVYEPEQGHVHAELMAMYAEDAKITTKPWKLWEFRELNGDWLNLSQHPMWVFDMEYRRKPMTHVVHGVEIPDLRIKELKEAPLDHSCISYRVDPLDEEFWGEHYPVDSEATKRFLRLGILYEYTEEGKQAAILHTKAMLGIT